MPGPALDPLGGLIDECDNWYAGVPGRTIMTYARIPLNFAVMSKAYRDFRSLPHDMATWLKNQNDLEKKLWLEKHETLEGIKLSTSCCLQASLSFNATKQPIPKAGPVNWDNLTLDAGKHYIYSVNEFRAYLTYKYGPTDPVPDLKSIKGTTGVLTFGGAHIEFWDGDNIFQSAGGAKKRGGNPGAVMGAAILTAQPRLFWRISEFATPKSAATPEWLQGWWTIYDGNYYYYYFYEDLTVSYIKTRPNPKWTPEKTVGNHGKMTILNDHSFKVVWQQLGPPPATEETFTRLGWTSTTEMNADSNKYSPIYARKT